MISLFILMFGLDLLSAQPLETSESEIARDNFIKMYSKVVTVEYHFMKRVLHHHILKN